MIEYIKDPNNATRKILEYINEFDNIAGDKTNTQKTVAFFIH